MSRGSLPGAVLCVFVGCGAGAAARPPLPIAQFRNQSPNPPWPGGFFLPCRWQSRPPSMGAEHPQTCSVQILGAPVGLGLWELLLWGRGECVIPSFVGLQGWGSPAAVPRDLDKVNLG